MKTDVFFAGLASA